MGTDHFEDFLRDELSSFPDEKGADGLWLGIEQALDRQERKKKSPLFFWWFFLGLLLLGIGLAFFFVQKLPKTSDVENDVIANTATEAATSKAATSAPRAGKQSIREAITTLPNKETATSLASVWQQPAPSLPSPLKTVTSQQQSPSSPSPLLFLPPIEAATQEQKKQAIRVAPLASLPLQSWASSLGEIHTAPLPTPTVLLPPMTDQPGLATRPQNKKQQDAAFRESKPALKNGYWEIQAESGITKLNWQYNAREMSGENYAAFRNEVENSQLGFQTGLSIRRVNAKGWWWKSGLFYQENWVKASFQQVTMDSVLKQNVVVRLLVDPWSRQVVDSIYGDAMVARRRSEVFVHHNQFNYLQIPLSIGYEWGGKQKFSFGLEAGAGLNLWWQRKGLILGENRERLNLADASTQELSSAGVFISTQFSPLVRYRLAPNFSVFLRPTVDISWSDWMSDRSPLRNRPIQAGLNLGASYRL